MQAEGTCPVCGERSRTGSAHDETLASETPTGTRGSSAVKPSFPGLEIIEEIAPGVGGMGTVYRARETALSRIVAVKTFRADRDSPSVRQFFMNEAPAAAQLEHQHILRIHRFEADHTPPYFVMQYVDGVTLDVACRNRDFHLVATQVEKVARALEYAHARGIVHRDIKPGNILVDRDGEPHVADFGLAARFEQPSSVEHLAGTPAFIAPEIYADPARVTPGADVYALGVTLYRLVTGRYPFAGTDAKDLRTAVLEQQPPLPMEIEPSVPEDLQRVCLKAMERNPALRYESARALAEDLRRFREGKEVYARPSRYATELRGKLQNLMTDVHTWHDQRLIDVREYDRLSRPARRLVESPYPWHQLSVRFPWETVLLRLGGWLVLIASLLWLMFYWHRLGTVQRLLAEGLPMFALNTVGWVLAFRGSRVNALIFLSSGALLVPIFTSVLLTEFHWLEHRQDDRLELFVNPAQPANPEIAAVEGTAASTRPHIQLPHRLPEGESAHRTYAPTNMQLLVSTGAFVVYCVLLLFAVRSSLISTWACIGLYALYFCFLMRLGLKVWITDGANALINLTWLAMPLFLLGVALLLGRGSRLRPYAATAFGFFPLPFALFFSQWVYWGAIEWLEIDPEWTSRGLNLMIMGAGAVYLLLALWAYSSKKDYIRFWGPVLMFLVPLHMGVPSNMLFDQGFGLFKMGDRWLTVFGLMALLVSLGMLVLGTRLRVMALAIPAVVTLLVWCIRVTVAHFLPYLGWPLTLMILGAVAMLGATVLLVRRTRGLKQSML